MSPAPQAERSRPYVDAWLLVTTKCLELFIRCQGVSRERRWLRFHVYEVLAMSLLLYRNRADIIQGTIQEA